MTWLTQVVKAFRAQGSGSSRSERPRPGQVVLPRRQDSLRDYPSAGLTPSRLLAILREADEGSLSTPMQLFEEMEEKDAHLFSVAHTRRLALTGLKWGIVSAADVDDPADSGPNRGTGRVARGDSDRGLADAAADYCRTVLRSLEGFEEVLQHLSLALGRNIAIAEIVWDVRDGELRPVELVPVDFTRIVFDELDRPRILTEAEPQKGIELPPHKFIVHTPHAVSGHPQRGGLLRVTAMVYLAKNLALKDWMIFAEIFGMPVRIARYEPSATAEEKRELLTMLESLGSHAAGVFSRAVELQFIEANRGTAGPPYQNLIEFLNREMSKAWLGQTLTTDISGQSGSVAASRIHETVRQDLLADDLRKEARTIRRDLLTPIVRFKFGADAAVPHFRRRLKNEMAPTELLSVIEGATRRLGLSVPAGWAHEALGIPRARGGEPTIGKSE
jgi:phage gp29-like protein